MALQPSTSDGSQPKRSDFLILFEEGQAFYRRQDWCASVEHFLQMLQRWPKNGSVLLFVGGSYAALRQFDVSVFYLKKAVVAKPEEELVSRCLFRSLWCCGCEDEAYQELQRYVFITGHYSEHYELLLQDMRGEVTTEHFWQKVADIDEKEKKL